MLTIFYFVLKFCCLFVAAAAAAADTAVDILKYIYSLSGVSVHRQSTFSIEVVDTISQFSLAQGQVRNQDCVSFFSHQSIRQPFDVVVVVVVAPQSSAPGTTGCPPPSPAMGGSLMRPKLNCWHQNTCCVSFEILRLMFLNPDEGIKCFHVIWCHKLGFCAWFLRLDTCLPYFVNPTTVGAIALLQLKVECGHLGKILTGWSYLTKDKRTILRVILLSCYVRVVICKISK